LPATSQRVPFLSCLAALCLATAVEAAPAPSLVGIWLGRGQPSDGNIVYVSEIRADGTFRSEFRRYDGCTVTETSRESGTWMLDGTMQEMVTREVNGRPVNFGNSFSIERLTETEQHARQLKNGHLYVEHRIPRFEFPACREPG
jgi:hypothetical protein